MNRVIFKYPLELAGHQKLALPSGALPLALQMQFNTPMLWAIVDPSAPIEHFDVVMEATGQEHSELFCRHLGTVQDGPFVWHFFARP